jgi:3-dehydroquinate dehydratase
MNIHAAVEIADALTPKNIGTCETHMGQHKKRKDCKMWVSIAPLVVR